MISLPYSNPTMTSNKIIIEYAISYRKIKSLNRKEIAAINQIRLFKQLLLPYKLVGLSGRDTTKYFQEINKKEPTIIEVFIARNTQTTWKVDNNKMDRVLEFFIVTANLQHL